MNPIELEVNQIELRLNFYYRLGPTTEELEQSFKKYGIIQPLVLVREKDGSYFLIDGAKRWTYARQHNASLLTAFVYPAESLAEIYESNLILNEAAGILSTTEKLLAVLKARQLGEDGQKVALKITGLDRAKDVPAILDWFQVLPVDVQIYLHESNAGLKWLSRLKKYSFSEFYLWFELGRQLLLKARELAELLDQVVDISAGSGISPLQLYKGGKIEVLLKSRQTSQQKVRQLKQSVAEMRYPKLTRINNTLQSLAQSLGKESDKMFSLQWDPTLEKNNLLLTVNLNTAESIKQLRAAFENENIIKIIAACVKTLNGLGE